MKIILTNHFRKRYKERVGPLSDTLAKQRIRKAVGEFSGNIMFAKFRMGDFIVTAQRAKGNPNCWKCITIVRDK